mmetsp:Transcript_15583/g.25812  ORF Transcript_15583/g.25812 Transcript_15583/m.25812 type:complete len:217 (-) Transcript_15583:283-933(-)
MNLYGQFSCGGKDECYWGGLRPAAIASRLLWWWSQSQHFRDDWEEERCSLARACLCTSHEVSACFGYWNRMLLYWGRLRVLCHPDVCLKLRRQVQLHKRLNWRRDVCSTRLNWYVVELVEIYSGIRGGEDRVVDFFCTDHSRLPVDPGRRRCCRFGNTSSPSGSALASAAECSCSLSIKFSHRRRNRRGLRCTASRRRDIAPRRVARSSWAHAASG